ncbi:T9SS type B sorting domain-containing protein [Spongiivirga citrea]|uniref:T9SS type B sorting domain-containing protein n=1 Tax=Spongiivirga citrea TaxID=1481457 RepID=A0A6M0CK92_9FLAO|nr:gliding motility-associated C-terminal domain-containing protein [Spongiivirga citrea]NER15857.1 T9SS type B sorting domain-containing protein [Spongiivirga citrea]
MKTKHYLLLFFCIGAGAFTSMKAQYTAIPDPNFEAFLAPQDDIPNDGQVPTANIEVIANLFITPTPTTINITDLTGIEDFAALSTVVVRGIPVTTVDLSNNLNLITIDFIGSSLNTINLGTNNNIQSLFLGQNQLATIDISGLSGLVDLRAENNQLTTIDLSNNTQLTRLWVNDNSINILDLRNNLLLNNIRLQNNQLLTLDLRRNTALQFIELQSNQIADLNVSTLLDLRSISLDGNSMQNLDFSQNAQLQQAGLRIGSSLENLNLANGNNANFASILANNNPNLSCIQVDDPNANVSTITKDAAASFSANCAPFVTITSTPNFPSEITGDQQLIFTLSIEFSSPVTGFDSFSDISGTNFGFQNQITALSSTLYQVDIRNLRTCGDPVTLQVLGGAAQDVNTSTDNVASSIITIPTRDIVPPIVDFKTSTPLRLDASGGGVVTQALVINGTPSDPGCNLPSDLTISFSPTNFSCADIGPNAIPVTVTVTDLDGNSTVGVVNVFVTENIPPVVQTKDFTLQLDANGQAVLDPNDIDDGSVDNCSLTSTLFKQVDKSNFTCADLGANTVTLFVTDNIGNRGTATATVTVVDTVPAVAVCQDITVQLDANGVGTIQAIDIDNGSGSGCDSVTLSVDQDTFTCADLGANTVTLTVNDGTTTDSCTATVTIEDNVAPIAIAQDITIQLDGNGQASISAADINNNSTDNCAIGTFNIDVSSFNCSNLGANTVTLSVTDTSGNTATATATVTVEDNLTPIAVAAGFTIPLDPNGQVTITGANVDNGSSDNCSVNLTLSQSTFDCSNLGANTVTLTVTDPSGNTDTATAIITVEDNQPLTAIARDITVQLDANGQTIITPQDVDNGSGSGCGNITLSLDTTSFTCNDIGQNTVTLTATEGPNTETATAVVTVEDNVPPSITPQVLTIELDINGQASITTADVDNGSSDNCGIASSSLDITNFDCSNIGANTVTLTVVDAQGNVGSSTTTVTVTDTVAPTAITQDITIQLDGTGNASITAQQIDNGSTDNCAVDTLSLDQTDFDCSNLGINTVTLTVIDASGNSATATAVVTVEEDPNQPLTAIAQDITVQLDPNGSVTITPQDVDNGSNSGCNSSPTLSLDIDTFDCSNLGANTVTLTVTQGSATSTATATITVEDTLAPTVTTQDITVTLDTNGDGSIAPSDINNGSTDNCTADADLTYALDTTTFDCSNLGANTVTLTVTDAQSNVSTGIATVTVTEDVAPTIVTQDITVSLDANGQASITAADIDNGSTDDCSGIASTSLDITDFDCPGLGDVTVTLTVTDNEGNTATGTATVTITATDEDGNGIADDCESKEIVTPQGFSPNGDTINDTWVIENIDDFPNSKVTVYNRWGQKVFEANNYQNDWDGTSTEAGSGNRLPAGSYLYVIELNDPDFPPKQGWIYINY